MSANPSMVNGLGWCAEDDCEEYDGKRCRLAGFRPHGICEPWAQKRVKEIAQLRAGRDAALELIRSRTDSCKLCKGKGTITTNPWVCGPDGRGRFASCTVVCGLCGHILAMARALGGV